MKYQFQFVSMLQNAYYTRCKDDAAVLRYAALPTKSARLLSAVAQICFAGALCADAGADFITAALLLLLQTVHRPYG